MPYARQARLLRDAGFASVRQFLRLNQLELENVASEPGRISQQQHFQALFDGTRNGLTSIVVAVKSGTRDPDPQRGTTNSRRTARGPLARWTRWPWRLW
jgi:hypothetical protein